MTTPDTRLGRLLAGRTDQLVPQLVRYAVVGGAAYVVDFGVLALLTELAGVHYLWSAAIGFLCGLAVNYLIAVRWVFATRRVENRRVEFAVYALVGIAGLGLTELFMWLLTERGGLYYLLSKVVTSGLVLLWNFAARRFLLFRPVSPG